MSRTRRLAPLPRCTLVWLAATGVCLATVGRLAARRSSDLSLDLARLDATPFDTLLAHGCAVALVVCALWLWLVTSLLMLEAVTGLPLWRAGCPPGLRRVLLGACGAAMVGATSVTPAGADTTVGLPPAPPETTPSALEGLRLPDRTTARTPAPTPAAPPPAQGTGATVHVETGDTLWDLARARLPESASDAEITRAWQSLWLDNRGLIGPDPDLIHPGTVLHLTDPKEHR